MSEEVILEILGYRLMKAPNRFRRMWPGMVPERFEAYKNILQRMATEYPDNGHPVGFLMNVWDWQEYLIWATEAIAVIVDDRFFMLIVPERKFYDNHGNK